jgi:hypothetical protein
VWVTPTDPQLRGRALVASIIDCWFPPSFMRAVRGYLGNPQQLHEPTRTVLCAASVSFSASTSIYDLAHHAVLASQIVSTADGYYFERSEVWSDQGALLATAELLRREQERRAPTPDRSGRSAQA